MRQIGCLLLVMRLVLSGLNCRLISAVTRAVPPFIVEVAHRARAVMRSVLHKRQPRRCELLAQSRQFVALLDGEINAIARNLNNTFIFSVSAHLLPLFKYPASVHPAWAWFSHLVLASSPRATHNPALKRDRPQAAGPLALRSASAVLANLLYTQHSFRRATIGCHPNSVTVLSTFVRTIQVFWGLLSPETNWSFLNHALICNHKCP